MPLLVSSFTQKEIAVLREGLPLFEVISSNSDRIIAAALKQAKKSKSASGALFKFQILDDKLAEGHDELLSQEEADILCHSLLCTSFDISGSIRTINELFVEHKNALVVFDHHAASDMISRFDAIQSLLQKIVPHVSAECISDMSEYDFKKWRELPLELRGLADF